MPGAAAPGKLQTQYNKPRVQALAGISRPAICCQSNETRVPIANPPNSAHLGYPYHSPSYIRVRAVVWECGERQTDTQTAMTTVHFSSATPHAKCKNSSRKDGADSADK